LKSLPQNEAEVPLKIAAIGLTGHIHYLFEGLRRNPELALVGIAGVTEVDSIEDGRRLAAEFGCPYFEDYRRLLDETRPEVAGVSTRYDRNGPISIECLERGIHCLTEKCVALDVETLARIRSLVDRGPARILGMHTMRYTPEFFSIWQAVQEGRIGKPRLFTGQKSYRFGSSRPDFYRKRALYGGTIPWVGAHAVDWAVWTMGTFESLWAAHDTDENFGYGEFEAHAALSFRFKSGGEGLISADFYRSSTAETHGDDRVRLAGPKGIVEARGGKA